MNAHVKRMIRKLISPIRRIGLKNRDFSIISNNCWGGFIYDIFGLKYLSPTIGLFFFSNDYIKFLSNLRYYLSIEAIPLEKNKSKHKEELEKMGINNPKIGCIDDIEIIFVHYNNLDDGIEKWNKRRKRINYDNLLVKYNDQNSFDEADLLKYLELDYKNKYFFSSKSKYCHNKNCIFFKKYQNDKYILDDIKTSFRYINIKKILNELNSKGNN